MVNFDLIGLSYYELKELSAKINLPLDYLVLSSQDINVIMEFLKNNQNEVMFLRFKGKILNSNNPNWLFRFAEQYNDITINNEMASALLSCSDSEEKLRILYKFLYLPNTYKLTIESEIERLKKMNLRCYKMN